MEQADARVLTIARDALDTEPDQRDDFVSIRCGADTALRERVAALLDGIVRAEREEDAGRDARRSRAEGEASARDALIGMRLGPFAVAERIGRGGMGVVYRGERADGDFTQEVALKLIRRGYDFDDVHARFLRERRILARLAHPNLARFIDGGVAADGRPWFALEFVRGQTITRWCDDRRLDIRTRVRLFLDVCAAVQYAHTQLIVHRDLKPGNVLVDETGSIRLLDFGIARLLGGDGDAPTLTTIGARHALTPEYAAPEQFTDEPAGVAADVYSLGVILYELIAGVLPYAIDRLDLVSAERSVRETPPQALTQAIARMQDVGLASSTAILDQRLGVRATTLRAFRTEVRGDLGRILDKALAKEPARRYATVAAFGADLGRWVAGETVRVSGNRLGYRVTKFVKRNRVAVGTAAILVVALLATTAWAIRSAWRERIQREAALHDAARATAVNDYVMLMFRDAGEKPSASTLSARDVLSAGAASIAKRFADEPETGQRIALTLAGLYARLGDTAGATPLLEQVLAWPGIDKNPEILADARAQLAEVEYYQSHIARSRTLLEQARAWWDREPQRYAKQLNDSLITRSQIERAEGQIDSSIATLEEAIAARRALLGAPDRDLGIALGTLSVALIQAGRYDDAVRRADDALIAFAAIGQDNSVPALAALSNRGTAAMNAGRYEDAERDLRRAADLRRHLYGPSPELAQVQNSLGMSLVRQRRYDEAIALFEESLAMAISRGGETTRYALSLRGNLAEAYVVEGRVAEAVPLADAAVRIAHEQFADKGPFAASALRARAAVRIAQGRRDEAQADLDAATAIFKALGKGGEVQLKTVAAMRDKLAER